MQPVINSHVIRSRRRSLPMGSRVSDFLKRSDTVQCPRCKAMMEEVVRIAPLQDEPGLIGYECPSCKYVTSFFWQAQEPKAE
jgi:hypothetical protein